MEEAIKIFKTSRDPEELETYEEGAGYLYMRKMDIEVLEKYNLKIDLLLPVTLMSEFKEQDEKAIKEIYAETNALKITLKNLESKYCSNESEIHMVGTYNDINKYINKFKYMGDEDETIRDIAACTDILFKVV